MDGSNRSTGVFAAAAFAVGILFTVPGVTLVILGILMLVSGESGFTDAVPWWFLMLFAGFIAIIPGVVFLFVSRRLRKVERAVSPLKGE